MQESVGLQSATDGEFRRTSWHMDFIYSLGGISRTDEKITVHFENEKGNLDFESAALKVHDHVRLEKTIFADAFSFLKQQVTTATPKLTIPSPSMVHYRGGPAAIDKSVYPDIEMFWADLIAAYAEEVRRLGELGVTYLQLDDTSLAYLNDPRQREMMSSARRRRRAPARALHPQHQCRARTQARRHAGHDAHVPRQLPVIVDSVGRLRLRRRGAVRATRRRRLLPRIRRPAFGRLLTAAIRAARQDGRSRAW